MSAKLRFGRWLGFPARRALLLPACIAAWAVFPATGQAAPEGDATMQIEAFTVPEGQAGDGQPFCPVGSRVVGGGVTLASGAGSGYVRVSGPLDETGLTSNLNDGDVGRSWYAYVENSGPGANTYVASALCSAGSDATIRTDPFSAAEFQTADGQPFCPPGSRVIGGGVTLASGAVGGSVVRVSGPLDETGLTSNLTDGDVGRSWYANVGNFGPGTNNYVAAAICSPGSDATIRVDPFTLQAGQRGDGQPFCPTGTRVVGGGSVNGYVQVGPLDETGLLSNGPLDETGLTSSLNNGDVGRSWYAYVYNGGPGAITYVAAAICASPPSPTGEVPTCKGKKATDYARPGVLARTFKGTSSKDVIVGTARKDKINARAGNDLVCAKGGPDKVKGGKGKDRAFGQGGRDKLLGGPGKDFLSGGGRNDTCVGGRGKDTERSC